MSDSLRPQGLQLTRLPCPSPSPRVCSNSCPLSQYCYLTILSSAVLFSICLQSFPTSTSFPVSWLFASSGQSIGASCEHSGLISFRTDWFDLALQGTLKSLLQHQFKSISSSLFSLLYCPVLPSVHDYWKNHSFDYTNLCLQKDVSAF